MNAVALLRSPLSPARLLARLHGIEARAGRARGVRWGARVLDLDLLGSGGLVRPNPATQTRWRQLSPDRQARDVPEQLILPHPRLQNRAFVLVPLAEVARGWRHPVTGRRVADMAARLTAAQRVHIRRLAGPIRGRGGVVNSKRQS